MTTMSSRLLILAPRLHKARSLTYEVSNGGDDVLVVVVVQKDRCCQLCSVAFRQLRSRSSSSAHPCVAVPEVVSEPYCSLPRCAPQL